MGVEETRTTEGSVFCDLSSSIPCHGSFDDRGVYTTIIVIILVLNVNISFLCVGLETRPNYSINFNGVRSTSHWLFTNLPPVTGGLYVRKLVFSYKPTKGPSSLIFFFLSQ